MGIQFKRTDIRKEVFQSPRTTPYNRNEVSRAIESSLLSILAPQVGLESSVKRIFNNMQVSG